MINMKIIWFTWKDGKNPLAGGAEIVNEELAKRLVDNNHQIIFLVSGFLGGVSEETRNGFKVIRLGNRFTVYWQAYKYYRKNLKGWADLVIDEINTIPFFCRFYVKEKNIIFIHQLCREIWFYQMPFLIGLIGYLLEPVYLWLLRGNQVITVSESTKKDLQRFGFNPKNIHVISEGIEIEPLSCLRNVDVEKLEQPTILSLGSVRSMKRTHHAIRAFEIAKEKIPKLKFWLAGVADGKYGQKVLNHINQSKFKSSIKYFGPVAKKRKIELLRKAHLLCVTSVKEGWGLVVTEAASQGTPAVVYNVDGLRDSVKNDETGLICQKNKPAELAQGFISLLVDREKYKKLQKQAWQWSKEINFDKSYKDFKRAIEVS